MGQQFALMEIKLIAAYLLEACHFERVEFEPIEPEVLVTLHPSRMLHMRVLERVTA
jgi:cytochrome P450